jgi:hypothetical protein
VPDSFKTPEVVEMEDYLRELIKGIDSSLLEEWERMRNPEFVAEEASDKPARPSTYDITRDRTGFLRLLRTAIFGFMQDIAARDWESAAERMRSGLAGSTSDNEAILSPEAKAIEQALTPYLAERGRFRLDPAGRGAANTHLDEESSPGEWRIAQVLIDSQDLNDWELRFSLSLAESRAQIRPVLRFEGAGPIGG